VTPFWLSLLAKMASSAVIVVTASLVVERAGPAIGALVATLPISAGPAYAFLALEHDPAFLSRATLASLAVNAGTAPFILVYAALAQRRGVLVSLGTALAVWIGIATLLSGLVLDVAVAAALNAAAYAGTYVLSRPYRSAPRPARSAARWWDLPARAATVMAVVGAVLLAGRWLGPRAAGVAALMPVVMTSLVLVLHPRAGGPATAAVLTNSVPGMIGFTSGLVTLHLAVVPLGPAAALLLGLAICLAWNAVLLGLALRSGRLAQGSGRP
jgi:hypothetical protein